MTCSCDAPSGDDDRKEPADAPAIAAVLPQARRLLRALFAWAKAPAGKHRHARLHRFNDHMLRDIGMARDEETERIRLSN